MEQRNNNHNGVILEIENLLKKMSNQVNFLIRKEISLNQLDVDLLMENTRKLYDTICSVELGVRSEELGVEEFEEDNDDNEHIDFKNEEEDDEEADMVWDFTKEELEIEESRDVTPVASEELGVEELGVEEFEEDNDDNELIDFENKEEDEDNEEELIIVEEEEDEVSEKEEDSGIRAYRVVRENIPTLGDMLEQSEDKSLAARLQRKPVSDLITAIGINDKFLFLNELFGGSMEKYNKSIRSLNGFSTLLGAKTYMSELQIEFQWDCTSDAYKKLNDLVERRFI